MAVDLVSLKIQSFERGHTCSVKRRQSVVVQVQFGERGHSTGRERSDFVFSQVEALKHRLIFSGNSGNTRLGKLKFHEITLDGNGGTFDCSLCPFVICGSRRVDKVRHLITITPVDNHRFVDGRTPSEQFQFRTHFLVSGKRQNCCCSIAKRDSKQHCHE